ncbi:CYTH domain-containing protein [Sinomicrobium sp. M5D2P9]
MVEIERKFIVGSEKYKEEAQRAIRIVQGFLNTHPERTVRVRIKGNKGFITVKGKSGENGLSRFEWEKEIPVAEVEALLPLCEKGVIEKIRHEIKAGPHLIEVDEFLGDNTGLVIAEIELASEDEDFYRPAWLGEEVTGDVRYYNSQLSKKPYTTWTM